MSCSSLVLSYEKNLHENESIDWILSVAFRNLKYIKKKSMS